MPIRSFQQQPRKVLMTQVPPGTRAISVPREDAALSQTGLRELREQFLLREPQLPDLGNGENSTQSPNLLCWYENQTGAVLVKGALSHEVIHEKGRGVDGGRDGHCCFSSGLEPQARVVSRHQASMLCAWPRLGGIATYRLCGSNWRRQTSCGPTRGSHWARPKVRQEARGEVGRKSLTSTDLPDASNGVMKAPPHRTVFMLGDVPHFLPFVMKNPAPPASRNTDPLLRPLWAAGLLQDLQGWPDTQEEGQAQTQGTRLAPSAVAWGSNNN